MLFQHISSKLEGETNKVENFCLVEKWRKIERPLGESSKVLRVWLAWGEDKTEVKLVVKRNVSALETSGPQLETTRVKRKRSKMVKKADTVHPRTLMVEKEKCKDSIQKLMKIIITQGNTIQTQLAGLREKEEAIDNFEVRMHQVRMAESGRDYLLQTYLDQLSDKNQSKDTSSLLDVFPQTSHTLSPCGVPPQEISHWTETLGKINKINTDLTVKEEEMLKLNQRTRSLSERLKSTAVVVPELEEIFRLPRGTLERELCLSRDEVESLIEAINNTIEESKKIESDLISIQERKVAGDIYIKSLLSDLSTAENEGLELQKEFDWILSLPPSAFASPEMLEWLRRDSQEEDTDSELGLELSCQENSSPSSCRPLLPDQVHPSRPDQTRSSSTGSTSSGISSDLQSLVSPEPDSKSSSSSSIKPQLPPKRRLTLKLEEKFPDEDNNSDTGLSSLNSTAEDQFQLDTLV